MENFTPFASGIGGILIGLGAALMLVANGRIAGISGIFEGVVVPDEGTFGWKTAFVGGLMAGGAAMFWITPESFAVEIQRSTLGFIV
ncbi:MAG: YeeE/YedE family protein, partial [Bradymonadaceae bacterium]